MRILHVVHQYPPEHAAGTELYTKAIAHYQIEQGHDAAVFFPSGMVSRDDNARYRLHTQEDGVRVYAAATGRHSRAQVFASTLRDPGLRQSFAATLAAEAPDLVHVQHLMGLPVSLTKDVKAAGVPLVITLHDYWFPCANGQLITNYDNTVCDGPSLAWLNCARCAIARATEAPVGWLAPAVAPLMAYRGQQVQAALARADRVISLTEFVRNTYASLQMPVENMEVIPLGIDVPPGVPERAAGAHRGETPLHVVYAGSLAWQKGVHVLIEAVNQLPANVKLTICGGLDSFPDYTARLRALAQHPGIKFAGWVERDALWTLLLEEADVMVLPTLWYEASPAVIQETFAARTPIIASDIGALPEKIRDGVDGLLFPPGDVDALAGLLRRLVDDPAELERLRANIGPTRTMGEHAAAVTALYKRLV